MSEIEEAIVRRRSQSGAQKPARVDLETSGVRGFRRVPTDLTVRVFRAAVIQLVAEVEEGIVNAQSSTWNPEDDKVSPYISSPLDLYEITITRCFGCEASCTPLPPTTPPRHQHHQWHSL